MKQQMIYLVLLLGCVACGDEPQPPEQEPPPGSTTTLPDAAYIGTITLDEDDAQPRRAYMTLFSRDDSHQGSLFVETSIKSPVTYAVYPVQVTQARDALRLTFQSPTCQGNAAFCKTYQTLPAIRGAFQRSSLKFAPMVNGAPVRAIDLSIDPDLYREPDDGIRPSGCEPEPCTRPWPPEISDDTPTRTVLGSWSGSLFVSPQYLHPFGSMCSFEVRASKGQPYEVSLFECMGQSVVAIEDASLEYSGSRDVVMYSRLDGRLWRWSGQLNAQDVNQATNRLYRFYGHVDVSAEPVDRTQSPDTIPEWSYAGTFAFTSWGAGEP